MGGTTYGHGENVKQALIIDAGDDFCRAVDTNGVGAVVGLVADPVHVDRVWRDGNIHRQAFCLGTFVSTRTLGGHKVDILQCPDLGSSRNRDGIGFING